MRFALMLVVCAVVLAAADLKVDHVTAAGSSLKQLQANLSAIGIETVYGGPHSNGATEMALVSFPDGSYLELMAPRANADPQALARQPWAKFMQADGGPCAWAVREKDVAAEVERLRGPARSRSAGRRAPPNAARTSSVPLTQPPRLDAGAELSSTWPPGSVVSRPPPGRASGASSRSSAAATRCWSTGKAGSLASLTSHSSSTPIWPGGPVLKQMPWARHSASRSVSGGPGR